MKDLIARIGELLSTVARQAVPLGGVFARDWQPISALAIYWLESLLLALVAVTLCALLKRRTTEAAIDRARRSGGDEAARAVAIERAEAHAAGVEPRDVALVHVSSLFVFGGFLTAVLFIMIQNGHTSERFVWHEVRDGAIAMLAVVGVGFLIDLWRFPAMPVAAVQARVDSCTARWALFWMLGFFGIGLVVFTGRAGLFLGLFAALKCTFEVWGTLARTFGWRSLKDRQAAGG